MEGLPTPMPTGTFTLIQTFSTICCPTKTCGVTFAITKEYEGRRREDGKGFCCPSGHSMSYGTNELDELRAKAKRLERTVERRESDIRLEQRRLTTERRSHAATKGQLTKTRKRAAHALCPVPGCRRSFANVARHVANQHPSFVSAHFDTVTT